MGEDARGVSYVFFFGGGGGGKRREGLKVGWWYLYTHNIYIHTIYISYTYYIHIMSTIYVYVYIKINIYIKKYTQLDGSMMWIEYQKHLGLCFDHDQPGAVLRNQVEYLQITHHFTSLRVGR